MNDQELKNMFKSMKHGTPSELEMARWKKVVRHHLPKTPSEWTRLVAACLIGVIIGATAFHGKKDKAPENHEADATIERVYINL